MSGIKDNFFISQRFRKVRYRSFGRRSTVARSDLQISRQAQHFPHGTDFLAGTVLSQGQVQISWQAQHLGNR